MHITAVHIAAWKRWAMGAGIGLLIAVVPFVYYRHTYTYAKRLRVVTPGLVYRSGCLTADGFRDAIRKLNIRTVINLQEESPDPRLAKNYFNSSSIRESELCDELGVKFHFIFVETLDAGEAPLKQPDTIGEFLKIMDDPDAYPVLIHCRAGLHRTGCLVAAYRMEYECWPWHKALRELKNHGFGEFVSTSANDYIVQYILDYRPRWREQTEEPQEIDPPKRVAGKLTSR
ncbi:MAG: dual specificity protein phosphatase family protein [Planctomycetes bacterium]|nr:dual specificity protein phosphatase family protein [Planctomycetota bacterium]